MDKVQKSRLYYTITRTLLKRTVIPHCCTSNSVNVERTIFLLEILLFHMHVMVLHCIPLKQRHSIGVLVTLQGWTDLSVFFFIYCVFVLLFTLSSIFTTFLHFFSLLSFVIPLFFVLFSYLPSSFHLTHLSSCTNFWFFFLINFFFPSSICQPCL